MVLKESKEMPQVDEIVDSRLNLFPVMEILNINFLILMSYYNYEFTSLYEILETN